MGLLDKVKAQATAATEMAKDAAAKGQAKMNDAQAKKTADGMLRDLGAAFYATKTGRSTPATDGEMAQIPSTFVMTGSLRIGGATHPHHKEPDGTAR